MQVKPVTVKAVWENQWWRPSIELCGLSYAWNFATEIAIEVSGWGSKNPKAKTLEVDNHYFLVAEEQATMFLWGYFRRLLNWDDEEKHTKGSQVIY